MWSLPHPNVTAAEAFAASVSKVRSKELRDRLERSAIDVAQKALTFEASGNAEQLYALTTDQFQLTLVTSDEMTSLYQSGMVRFNSGARYIYEKIKLAPPHGRCPYCNQRRVYSLDHFLPKSVFPALAVTPLNL